MKMKRGYTVFLLLLISGESLSHEQWLTTSAQYNALSQANSNPLFRHITVFNGLIISLAILAISSWIVITGKILKERKANYTSFKINLALLCMRVWVGFMLVCCSLGLLPKSTIPFLQQPTLFAPDLFLNVLSPSWSFLQWAELGIGIWLLTGVWTRLAGFGLIILIVMSFITFGKPMIHYSGFYIAISLFLMINGGGRYSFYADKIQFNPYSLVILQTLTGLNFIYSAIAIKWLTPAVDIFLLQTTRAFTFGINADKFVLIMLVTEVSFGFLFILGRHLRWVTLIMLGFFMFLSFNLSENFLCHSFIYAILSVFLVLGGYPFYTKSDKQ